VPVKSSQLQIRVTSAQKAALRRLARRAGLDVSSYVLARVQPHVRARIDGLLRALRREPDRFVLAELNDVVSALAPAEFREAVADLDLEGLSPFLQNYVAAMVEHAAYQKGEEPPLWVHGVEPLERPHFAVPFVRLRPYLLGAAPVAFKRRNLFIDATIGDRV
jgi:hypothetical protein